MCIGGAPLARGHVVAVLVLLTAGASALRLDGGESPKPPHDGQRHAALYGNGGLQCPVEFGAFPEEPQPGNGGQSSPEVRLALGAGSNLSFVRQCESAKDVITHWQPMVLPHLKLAFCWVPKVACTQFKDLFNTLNGRGNADTLGFGRGYMASMPKNLGVPLDSITRENGWKFASFTRDPLLRYVSAFGSACTPIDNGKKVVYEHKFECCGPVVPIGSTYSEVKRTFQRHVMLDASRGLVEKDGHWVEQTEILSNCGWGKFKPETLDFWGHLTGDVNRQVKDMFKKVGYTNSTFIDEFFPPNKIDGHQSFLTPNARDLLQNRTILMSALKLFEDDYKLFPGIGCSFTDKILNGSSALDVLNNAGDKSRPKKRHRDRIKPWWR